MRVKDSHYLVYQLDSNTKPLVTLNYRCLALVHGKYTRIIIRRETIHRDDDIIQYSESGGNDSVRRSLRATTDAHPWTRRQCHSNDSEERRQLLATSTLGLPFASSIVQEPYLTDTQTLPCSDWNHQGLMRLGISTVRTFPSPSTSIRVAAAAGSASDRIGESP